MSKEQIVVRRAGVADAPGIHRVLRQLHPELPASTTLPRVRLEARTFVVGEPVAGVAVVTFVDYGAGAYGMLEELVVDRASRGAGLGSRLLAECREWLVGLGAEVVFVSAIDAEAAGFYRASGFVDCVGPWLYWGQGAVGGV
ncbi:GNAT family N-acetyltransferase [Kribbella sp. NBC_01505]|uniref:GNAT family N-acetyltransferase n=1 Tax=Kribbella sp. NBC_01505 TaxID=2903580 RepID=UPI00386CAD41